MALRSFLRRGWSDPVSGKTNLEYKWPICTAPNISGRSVLNIRDLLVPLADFVAKRSSIDVFLQHTSYLVFPEGNYIARHLNNVKAAILLLLLYPGSTLFRDSNLKDHTSENAAATLLSVVSPNTQRFLRNRARYIFPTRANELYGPSTESGSPYTATPL